jgi:hypothetical protein
MHYKAARARALARLDVAMDGLEALLYYPLQILG